MKTEILSQMLRRWCNGNNNSEIEQHLGVSRKTVAHYIQLFIASGLSKDLLSDLSQEQCEAKLQAIASSANNRKQTGNINDILEPYLDELKHLIHNKDNPTRPKTAFHVLKLKYNLAITYSSFKRFIRKNIEIKHKKILRIELPPSRQVQIDYGTVGFMIIDGKRRKIQAFCGILSHSRLPFIKYVLTQDQISFCENIADMFESYGGVVETIQMDNLKAAVVSPSLYDPVLNKSFNDLLIQYDTFADPSRVATPTDKGKIERFIPSARELFRRLIHIYTDVTLDELNKKANDWCKDEYGMTNHGTTGKKPFVAFEETERETLKPLPSEKFQVSVWKEVKVHVDRFIQFEKNYYCIPDEKLIGDTLQARKKGQILTLFHNHTPVREYVITNKKRNFLKGDFSEYEEMTMNGDTPRYLLKQAVKYGDNVGELIKSILSPNAYLNYRRAQGVLRVVEENHTYKYFDDVIGQAITQKIKSAESLKTLFAMDKDQFRFPELSTPMITSSLGLEMVRAADYYFN